jgi:hypothetical protein
MKGERWQIWVAKQVLARNLRNGTSDPPIIVRDRRAEPPHDWFMAGGVSFESGRLMHYPSSGSVFFLTDGPVEFEGLVAGIDPDATKPEG